MFNLEPSPLEQDIYSYVMNKLQTEGNNFDAYEKIEDALTNVMQEIMAQHKAALHFKYEELRTKGDEKC